MDNHQNTPKYEVEARPAYIARRRSTMRNNIELKKVKVLKIGEYILKPQHPNGILIARKVTTFKPIDCGKRVEIGTNDGKLHVLSDDKTFHVLNAEDVVVVIS